MKSRVEERVRKLFNRGCVDYGLLSDGDRILIALSGGKDSMELVRLMGQRARIFRPRIEVEAVHVVMDNVPYASDMDYLQAFCADCGVRLTVLHTSFEVRDGSKPPCFLCSWNRRKAIFSYATEHGFNKVALGHHQDDIIITLLMNMTYEGAATTMMPSLALKHYPLTIVRPLCLVPESLIAEVASEFGFRKQIRNCPYEDTTRRTDMQQVFATLQRLNPEARHSLWHSIFHNTQNGTE